jgi:hypothetical protein
MNYANAGNRRDPQFIISPKGMPGRIAIVRVSDSQHPSFPAPIVVITARRAITLLGIYVVS